ncbi:MAG: dicarboxylate/amino acid:cation symporter [Proteobacteria bacterium]|nr:dicarboxylate/amino acid:cation symporter [Pseudomonadota bacterium]
MHRSVKMLLGFVTGAVLGLSTWQVFSEAPWLPGLITNVMQPLGQLFLRMIFAAVVPLVFSSLVLGVYEMGDFRSLGRIAAKALLYTIFASSISVGIGLGLVSWLKPGAHFDQSLISASSASTLAPQSQHIVTQASQAKAPIQALVELIPKNPLDSAVKALDGEMLSLMIFALIFGAALLSVRRGREGDPLVAMFESLRDVSMKIVDFAMILAPLGIFALTFAMCAKFGWLLLWSLSKYVGVVVLGLGLQQFVVYGIFLAVFARRSLWSFLKDTKEVTIAAFSTASSNATLPISLRVAEDNLGLNKRVSSFVLTVGATANQNGTALFEGVTVLFLAQVYGIDLSIYQQLSVMAMSIIAGIGTAGVPGGSLPLIVIVLQSVGIPAEGIGIILGVDRFLDMCRTVLNVSGDLVAATVIDASERSHVST